MGAEKLGGFYTPTTILFSQLATSLMVGKIEKTLIGQNDLWNSK